MIMARLPDVVWVVLFLKSNTSGTKYRNMYVKQLYLWGFFIFVSQLKNLTRLVWNCSLYFQRRIFSCFYVFLLFILVYLLKTIFANLFLGLNWKKNCIRLAPSAFAQMIARYFTRSVFNVIEHIWFKISQNENKQFRFFYISFFAFLVTYYYQRSCYTIRGIPIKYFNVVNHF